MAGDDFDQPLTIVELQWLQVDHFVVDPIRKAFVFVVHIGNAT